MRLSSSPRAPFAGAHSSLARAGVAALLLASCAPTTEDERALYLTQGRDGAVADVINPNDAVRPTDGNQDVVMVVDASVDGTSPTDVPMMGDVPMTTDTPMPTDGPVPTDVPMGSDVVMMGDASVDVTPDVMMPSDVMGDAGTADVITPTDSSVPCTSTGPIQLNGNRTLIRSADLTNVGIFVPTSGSCTMDNFGLAGAPGRVNVAYGTTFLVRDIANFHYNPSGSNEGFTGTISVSSMPLTTTALVVSGLLDSRSLNGMVAVDLQPPVITGFSAGTLAGGSQVTTFTTDSPSFYSVDVIDTDRAGTSVLFHTYDPSYPPSMRIPCVLDGVTDTCRSAGSSGTLVGRNGISRALRCMPIATTSITADTLCDFNNRTNDTLSAVTGRVTRRMDAADYTYVNQRMAGMLPADGPTPTHVAIKLTVRDEAGNITVMTGVL